MTEKKISPEVITFGCRLNAFESEVIRNHAESAGLSNTTIFNTCAVTSEAERQAKIQIRKFRRNHPTTSIIVSGCAAQISPEKYENMPEVNLVLGNEEKLKLESYLPTNLRIKSKISDIMEVKRVPRQFINGFKSHSRAFVQIQQGCNHRCTFCIIPYGRGNSRSVSINQIAEQVNHLISQGYLEAVLTVDISSYGQDLPGKPTLGQMVRRLLRLAPDLERLRLSSIDPAVVDEELIDLFSSEPRLMPHLHLSVQAGSNLILKRMKRRHNRRDVISICARIRKIRPNIVFGADLIAGFPTETKALFRETLELIDEAGLTYLHIFPYSPRPETPAANMPQVEQSVRKNRAATLRKKGEETKASYFKTLKGQTAKILVERQNQGYTETYAPVSLTSNNQQGTIVSALITNSSARNLTAKTLATPL